jgi:hypothetical protein
MAPPASQPVPKPDEPPDAAQAGLSRIHWIYVLGSGEWLHQAALWRDRKTAEGKHYAIIAAPDNEIRTARLSSVSPHDVLYLYGPMTSATPRRIGDPPIAPEELAQRVEQEGLSPMHRDIKVFASHSGDRDVPDHGDRHGAEDRPSFAERLFCALQPRFPNIAVSGYRGEVNVEGFDSHKSAGLAAAENPKEIGVAAWDRRQLRASENRITFRGS